MKNYLEKIIPGLVIAIFGATIGFYLSNIKDRALNQEKDVDVYQNVAFTSFPKSDMDEHNLKMLYNGKSIYGLSTIDVELYNYSDLPINDLKAYIEIKPQDGDTLKLMDSTVVGPHSEIDGFTTISSEKLPKAAKGSLKYAYVVEFANPADSLLDVILDGSYSIVSNKKPTVTVTLVGERVGKREYDSAHFNKIPLWETDSAVLIYIIIGFVLYVFILVKISSYFTTKRSKKFKTFMLEKFDETIKEGKLNLDAESIFAIYKKTNDQFDYNDTSPIMRWIRRLKPPDGNS